MKTALILGGGFTGCAAAHQLMLMGGWQVTLVEAAPFLGAGNRTMFYGGHPYTFGPRHFLTPKPHLFEFLNSYVPMRRCADHEFLTYIERDHSFYGYPIHQDDIDVMPDREQIAAERRALNEEAIAMLPPAQRATMNEEELRRCNGASTARNFEEYWIRSIGQTLYGKFVDGYSKKMWMIDDNRLIDDFTWSPKGVTIKEGARACWDTAISAYPVALTGYDAYFDIATEGVEVRLSTKVEAYDIPSKTVRLDGETKRFDVIVNTISPDILFDHCYGELPYVGRELLKIVLPIEFALPQNVYFVYYANQEPFTRLTEYKKFTKYQSNTTLVTLEIPSKKNKLYPLPFESQKAIAQKYFDMMPDGVFSIGRAGSYLYNVDIDDTLDHAMMVAKKLKS